LSGTHRRETDGHDLTRAVGKGDLKRQHAGADDERGFAAVECECQRLSAAHAQDGGLRSDRGGNRAERCPLCGTAQRARVRPSLAACLHAGCHDQGLSLRRRNAIRIVVGRGPNRCLDPDQHAGQQPAALSGHARGQSFDLDQKNLCPSRNRRWAMRTRSDAGQQSDPNGALIEKRPVPRMSADDCERKGLPQQGDLR
jgi:hypothetical protein